MHQIKAIIPRRAASGHLPSTWVVPFNLFDIFQHQYCIWFLRCTSTHCRTVGHLEQSSGLQDKVTGMQLPHRADTRAIMSIADLRSHRHRPLLSMLFKCQHYSFFTLQLMSPLTPMSATLAVLSFVRDILVTWQINSKNGIMLKSVCSCRDWAQLQH